MTGSVHLTPKSGREADCSKSLLGAKSLHTCGHNHWTRLPTIRPYRSQRLDVFDRQPSVALDAGQSVARHSDQSRWEEIRSGRRC